MPNTITFKPEVITARRPRTTPPQAPKTEAPKTEPKPKQPNPGVIDMPPLEVTPGDSKAKCNKHLGEDRPGRSPDHRRRRHRPRQVQRRSAAEQFQPQLQLLGPRCLLRRQQPDLVTKARPSSQDRGLRS